MKHTLITSALFLLGAIGVDAAPVLPNLYDGREEAAKRYADSVYNTLCLLYTSDAADDRISVDLGGGGVI